MLTLEIRYVTGQVETRTFSASVVSVGRESGDLAMNDPQVSSRHAEIRVSGSTVTYVDLGSTNGSFAPDGQRVSTLPMELGSVVRMGGTTITVRGLPASRFGPSGTLAIDASEIPAQSPHLPVAHSAVPGAPGAFPVPDASGQGGTARAPGANPGETGAPAAPLTPAAAGGVPLTDDIGGFIKSCWETYQPYLVDGAKIMGFISVPPALIGAVLGLIPGLGALLGLLVNFVLLPFVLLATWLVGIGAVQEYSLRMAMGQPITSGQAYKVQLGRMIPFLIGTLPAIIVSIIGFFLCVIPMFLASAYLYPSYLVEGKGGVEPNKRSFHLLKAKWQAILPLVIVMIGVVVANAVLSGILGFLPIIGGFAGVASAIISAAVTPFVTFMQYRAYFEVRRQSEGDAPLQADLAKLPPVR